MPWAAVMCPEQLDLEDVQDLADCLVRMDVRYLRRHPETPPVYAAGLRYVKEPDRAGVEWWWLVPCHILRLGYADCKALACWRTAELIAAGDVGARAIAVRMDDERVRHRPPKRIHVVVVTGDGTLDDPSQRYAWHENEEARVS